MGEAVDARAGAARPPQRFVTRLVTDLALQVLAAYNTALGGRYRPAMILMALRHAGLEVNARDPARLVAYAREGGAGVTVRPIPVHALAASLNLSPETTRRAVAGLEAEGFCRRGPGGVGALPHRLTTPLDGLVADGFARICRQMADFGLDPLATWGGAAAAPDPRIGPDGARAAVALAAVDYLISLIGTILAAGEGNVLLNSVFIAVMSENAAPVTADRELAWRYAYADTPPPDQVRRPATVAAVAERLGLVHETVRRAALKAAAAGALERRRGGYLAPIPALQQEALLDRGLDLYRRFGRLNALLAAAGLHPLLQPQAAVVAA